MPCWLRRSLGRFQWLSRPRDDCRSVLLGWDVITVEQCQVRQGGNAADYFLNRPAMLSECGAPVSGGSGELVRLRRAWGCVQRALLLTIDDKNTSFQRKTAYEPRIEDVKNRPCLSRGLRYHENSCRGRIDSSPVAGTTLFGSLLQQSCFADKFLTDSLAWREKSLPSRTAAARWRDCSFSGLSDDSFGVGEGSDALAIRLPLLNIALLYVSGLPAMAGVSYSREYRESFTHETSLSPPAHKCLACPAVRGLDLERSMGTSDDDLDD